MSQLFPQTNQPLFPRPRFQVIINTTTPPQVDGIQWRVKRDKSFSQEFTVTQDDMSTKDVCPFDMSALPLDAGCSLVLSEEGGGYTSRGDAVIVCGMHGEELLPFYTPRGKANQLHAKFTVHKGIIVLANRMRDIFDVKLYRVETYAMAKFHTEQLWWTTTTELGLESSITGKVQDFKEAIRTACAKTECYHCRHAHYAKQRDILFS